MEQRTPEVQNNTTPFAVDRKMEMSCIPQRVLHPEGIDDNLSVTS